MVTPLVETRNLKKYFHTRKGLLHAVDDISIAVNKGETLGVVGESGCGKSTLGRLVLRLLEPTSGEVLFEGHDILQYDKKQMKKMRERSQIIFQDPYSSLNPRMTVSEIIAEPMIVNATYNSKNEMLNRVFELMDTVGLAERFVNAYPHELDGGRRQRIGIARALALNPQFIVCDEPVSALDVSIQAQILNLMMDLQDRNNLSYMFITHNLSVVRHISDHVVVMYLGQCIEEAPTDELFDNPCHPYTKALLEAVPEPNIRARKELKAIKGEVTSPVDPKPGCRFAPRCPEVMPQCWESDVNLANFTPRHRVACVLFN